MMKAFLSGGIRAYIAILSESSGVGSNDIKPLSTAMGKA